MKHLLLTVREIWKNRKNHFMLEKAYVQLPKDDNGAPELIHKWYYDSNSKEWVRDWRESPYIGIIVGCIAVLMMRLKFRKINKKLSSDLLRIDFSLVSVGDLLWIHDVSTTIKETPQD